ncbi:hypothetical protein [Terracidiphilus sp.]|jgi:hypothetical protein|uniref:hypothetical protein n=1 Tax=Terracidiphilus sp. TaxID=1964191 RepID=UPI003C22E40C
MNERIDQLAQELLTKTRDHKLWWRIMANPLGRDEFSVDLEEGYSFHIWLIVSGDNRAITLQLWKDGRPILDSFANNWPAMSNGEIDQERIKKFRAYSDLFDAVRESVYGGEETIGKVEQLLRKIG